MRLGAYLLPNGLKPLREPLCECHSGRINVLVSVQSPQQTTQFLFSLAPFTLNSRCGDPPFARSGIGPEAVADFPRSRSAAANMASSAHRHFSLLRLKL